MRRFIPRLADHLSDDRMARLFCHELTLPERLIARRHLAKCWQCRVRQEELEGRRADRMLDLYRDALEQSPLFLSPEPREDFSRRLDLYLQQAPPRGRWQLRWPTIAQIRLPLMNPLLATCMVLGFATLVSFFFWWQQRIPNISSNALLVRAERWDTPNLAKSNGVVFQEVRIAAPNQTIRRSIYRDPQGKRRLKQVKLAPHEEQLKNELTQAGLDWDEPISASDFQGWHDHQRVREDQITRAGKHLLTLTTLVPDGSVSEQSLTVRDTDFHPVRRTIAFRDSGTVEVAELDFKILPWSDVDANIFEPLSTDERVLTTMPRVIPFPRVPTLLTEAQLDEAELAARLVLNQLHADTNEQIAIHRGEQGVAVDGLVETDERKRVLQAQLRMVPHVTASIQSVDELKNKPGTNDGVVNIATASPPNQASRLQTYLEARGHSINDINLLAQRLFNAALTVSQESKAIVDLQTRFVPGAQQTVIASATLSELIYSHRERLEAALKQERVLLLDAQNVPADNRNAERPTSSLLDAADRNLALAKELTQTNSPTTRSAEQILAEMSMTINDLTVGMREANRKSQGDSTLSGKK